MDEPPTRRSLARTVAALLVSIVLMPSAALAQSPGDTQYADPLGGGGGGQNTAPQEPTGGDTPTSSDAPAAPADPTAAAPSTSSPAGAEPAATLPRTGADPLPLAVVGVALLSAGLLVHPRTARASR